MRKPTFLQQVLYQLALLVVALFVIIPIWELAYLAFDGGVIGWPTSFHFWPQKFTLDVFQQMWIRAGQSVSFLLALRNSLIVSGGAALLSIGLGASMAYAFAHFRFPGRQAGLFALLIGTLLPPVALMTPLYILLNALHLRTTLLALVIVYTSFSLPFAIWNMRAAFQSVPKELEEAAFLDGASRWVSFLKVSLPLALPAIAVAGLVAFLVGYSEFVMGWLFVERSDQVTLAMAISGILNGNNLSWAWLAALSILMCLPVVIMFILLQRSLLDRMLLGSIYD
jgi:arabinogalactan oligomer/maltooligosaccharide transport system permease protein